VFYIIERNILHLKATQSDKIIVNLHCTKQVLYLLLRGLLTHSW